MTATETQGAHKLKIGIVGPCTAGKTTLVAALRESGHQARQIVQEHSYTPSMWQRLNRPDILIYLDVSYEFSLRRRKLNWSAEEYAEQLHRLRHARQHADMYIHTDALTPAEVLQEAISFIQQKSVSSQ